jgi:hypothetical protein
MIKIIKILLIFFKRANISNNQTVTYFETTKKKLFPKSNTKILSPNEINSGVTTLDFHKNGDIILFRKEEVLKVLIHELIHSNLIDKNIIFSDLSQKFNNNFCVDYRILLNEGFTEATANILHILIIVIMKYL